MIEEKSQRRADRLEIMQHLYRHGFSRLLRLRTTDRQLKAYAKKVAISVVSNRRKAKLAIV